MYATVNVMEVSMIRVRIKVIANVMATAALVDNKSSCSTCVMNILFV